MIDTVYRNWVCLRRKFLMTTGIETISTGKEPLNFLIWLHKETKLKTLSSKNWIKLINHFNMFPYLIGSKIKQKRAELYASRWIKGHLMDKYGWKYAINYLKKKKVNEFQPLFSATESRPSDLLGLQIGFSSSGWILIFWNVELPPKQFKWAFWWLADSIFKIAHIVENKKFAFEWIVCHFMPYFQQDFNVDVLSYLMNWLPLCLSLTLINLNHLHHSLIHSTTSKIPR